ncbi:DUF6660 family protein [Pedobacter xixiisoli]|uniref:Uncharacterized protein n=1 Tax=Pedobacter xixiisoli TaxID=1476464 RepID=A0A286A8L7_9SPHI|nr:DUF6660 family protein [Pedobacter xixiisoli]SOD18256.1 hypothetical protein SAMN06297358_2907 [Pedobacter xixiisoli]
MKNLGAFFLLFVVLISLLPCTDEVECTDAPAVTSSQITHGDDKAVETCSSICMCACCGQRIVAVEQVKFQIKASVQFPNHTVKNYQFFLEQLDSNIWQPPKIA